jgi:hypothetical protein
MAERRGSYWDGQFTLLIIFEFHGQRFDRSLLRASHSVSEGHDKLEMPVGALTECLFL